MKKRILALILALFYILTPVAMAEEKPVFVKQGVETSLDMIKLFGITDKNEADILKSAILRLAGEDKDALHKVLDAIAKSVDSNSAYYSDEEWKEMQSDLTGVNGGIGIRGSVDGDYLTIVSLIEGGAAKKAGIQVGDRVVEVDGTDVTGNVAQIATKYLKGEIGTNVNVKVLRGETEILEFNMIRCEIVENSVSSTVLEDNIGYLNINSFTQKTSDECEDVFKDFQTKKVENLIIDLRNNGGGIVDSALKIASMLIDKNDKIITVVGKDPEDKTTYVSDSDPYNFKIVLLVNEHTASASEILTAALVENDKAVSIGETTYGKATMQQHFPLGQVGGVLKITIKQYLTPKDNKIHGTGMKPTIPVENRNFQYEFKELPRLSYLVKMDLNTEHPDVKGVETLLQLLHYPIDEPDEIYDIKTKNAIITFQREQELYAYGVCDITTQNYLVNKVLDSKFYEDNQFDAAVDYFKK